MCSTVQEQITTCGQNAIVKSGERTNIRPQKVRIKESQVYKGLMLIQWLFVLAGIFGSAANFVLAAIFVLAEKFVFCLFCCFTSPSQLLWPW